MEQAEKSGQIDWATFEAWRSSVIDAIELAFGPTHRNLSEFQSIKYNDLTNNSSVDPKISYYVGLSIARQRLIGMLYTLVKWLPNDEVTSTQSA